MERTLKVNAAIIGLTGSLLAIRKYDVGNITYDSNGISCPTCDPRVGVQA